MVNFFSELFALPRNGILIRQLAFAVTWEGPKNALQVPLKSCGAPGVYLPTDPSCLSPWRLNP